MSWMKRNAYFLISILFATTTLALFAPLEIYFTNATEFWFSLDVAVKVAAILAGCTFVLSLGIGLLLRGRAREVYSYILFVLVLLLYIQGNYANTNYGLLDGATIDWSSYSLYGVMDTIGWILVLAALVVLWIKKQAWAKLAQKYVALFIVAIQIITLGVLFVTADVDDTEKSSYYLSTEGEFELSKNENIIIFVLDAFDDQDFEDIIESFPMETRQTFKDFVRFNNASVCGAHTKIALPAILSGKPFLGGQEYTEYIMETFDSDGLYTKLQKNDYDVRLYTNSTFVPDGSESIVQNQVSTGYSVSSYCGLARKYSNLVFYKYMPHHAKQLFWFYSGDFDQFKEGTSAESYIVNDAEYYSNVDKLTATLEKNALRLYHLNGAHPPYVINEYVQEVRAEETSILQQARGALLIVKSYIERMKALCVYDDATIIIMADHGREDPAHGVLLIKRAGNNAEYCESTAPVSYFDLHSTLFKCLGNNEAVSFFDIEESEERERYFYFNDTSISKMNTVEYVINGDMDVGGSRVATGNIFYATADQEDYQFGTLLTFGAECSAGQYVVLGLSSTDMKDFSWTDGKECVFRIPLRCAPKNDLLVTIDVLTPYLMNGAQEVIVYVNDEESHRELLSEGGIIQFMVHESRIDKEKPIVELRLDLPNAVSPYELFGEGQDTRTLGLALKGLTISEID